jgi:UDP-2,3-diacylglucosamine pyrophosphatase LpxH
VTTYVESISSKAFVLQHVKSIRNSWRVRADRRLTEVFRSAHHIPFDDSSRFILFSDCHRGDKSRADAFAQNEGLFINALSHYYRRGFHYVEVGDGDELWQNRRFSAVRQAHHRTYDLLHRFNSRGGLHLILGNHDIQGRQRDGMDKDGLPVHEGLVLRHARTSQRIFVVHGHQVDFKSDYLQLMARFATRHIWRRIQLLGIGSRPSQVEETRNRSRIRQRLVEWADTHSQMIICGHTHTPAFPANGGAPYFNTGSCVYNDYITGLEIKDGWIALVKWSRPSISGREGRPASRELLTRPRRLQQFAFPPH